MASAMEVAKKIIAINDQLLDEWAQRPGYAQMTGCTDDSASLAGARKIDEENAGKEWRDTRSAIYSRAAAMITAYAKQVRADEAQKCDADYKLYKDGDKWCCVRRGFIDLQESDAWFGDTPEEALGLAITQGKDDPRDAHWDTLSRQTQKAHENKSLG